MKVLSFICLFIINSSIFSQTGDLSQKVSQKTILIFPEITTANLAEVSAVILSDELIDHAIYVQGGHNVMLIDFNPNAFNLHYGEALKRLDPVFGMSKILFKSPIVYDEIMGSLTKIPHSIIK
ncbi:MAG: hypothetical protein IM600_07620 [Bacteroidetes bacterium]|jgi:hypothetical protein|nr:hypothetical protein [Bacteroidota bacterium]MCA6443278.1 hypothetical protein [Bacteroidota bacterium]